MKKEEINQLLDLMCQEMAYLEKAKNANISKDFTISLGKLAEVENILQHIIDRMYNENVPYLEEVLCNFVQLKGMNLNEKQMVKLSKVPTKSPIYSETDIVFAIMSCVEDKLSKTTIKKIALSLDHCADEFFSDYIDHLWENIFKDDISPKEKEKARKIYEETKDWFFDEGWL